MLLRDVVTILLLVGVLLAAPLGGPSPFAVITPGGTYEIAQRLHVPDENRRPMGRLAFTAVFAQDASYLDVARAKAFGRADVVPITDVRPPGTTQQQVNENNRRLINESKPIAAVVGLRAAGYEVSITGEGARVESVVRGMPADGVLGVGDLIVAVDGKASPTTNTLIELVRQRQVGDPVTLTVQREGAGRQDVVLGTRPSPSDPNRAAIGISISTYLFDVRLPFPVELDSDNVGGPSAGFMFALGILDAVTEGDLTRGMFVAGTGTITQDGLVGAVGGAAEKAIAAEKDGAQVFMVPKDNVEDARKWVRNIQVVPIERFDDAVTFLCGLEPREVGLASPMTPAPCAKLAAAAP
jgi:Lon-like protease